MAPAPHPTRVFPARSSPARAAACIALALLALAGTALPGSAVAEVRRCMLPNGQTLYTDRRCADLGAVERRAPAATGTTTASTRIYRAGCARNFQDLLYELTTAIDSRDVNRLAALYHWPGMSATPALRVMRQLDAIVQRPLVDIVPIQAATPEDADGYEGYYVQTTTRRPPVGLRLEQTLANGTTPSRTVLGLRRYMDCWWVSF
jgi:hypothetical protein